MNTVAHDLLIIGAGPAGMAAATTVAGLGLKVAVVDEQSTPGGQIYRSAGDQMIADPRILGPDYQYGKGLVEDYLGAAVERITGATVWQVTRDLEVGISVGGASRLLRGRQIILATGAQERPVPFPGWTLPGVMACGAGQVLMKSAALVPTGPLVLAGSGPLLLLMGWQFLRAGVKISALVDTTPRDNWRRALPHLPGALRAWPYLVKGLRLMAALRLARVPIIAGATNLRAEADKDGYLQALSCVARNTRRTLPCNLLLVHQGVVPNVQITRSLDCKHAWDTAQRCWRPVTDAWGSIDVEGMFVAGDGAGIGGAYVAEHQGRLAALEAAHRLDRLAAAQRDEMARPEREAITANLRIRPFLDALYAPAPEFLNPSDDTIVCRCEEVTAGDVRRFVGLGCLGPNQTKAFGRPGMGPCQGRFCGLTVSEVIAAERKVAVEEIGYYHIRPPIKPITLGELAATAVLSSDTEPEECHDH